MEGTSRKRVPARLDRDSVLFKKILFQAVGSVAFTLVTLLILWAVFLSPEYGRPSWWAQLVVPIAVIWVTYLTILNTRALLLALGLLPFATVSVESDTRVMAFLWWPIKRELVIPADAVTQLAVERFAHETKQSTVMGVVVVLEVDGVGQFRIPVPHADHTYDWETWAAQEFKAIPLLVVLPAEGKGDH
ncbi:hypothetical protein ACNI3K_09385 [Demequina sp. SO4-13]|uniref:hypothetical protein n=1 Tax=Demequina sp. SO4-13 TaxID=3401027 RepID=UPI003AF7277A